MEIQKEKKHDNETLNPTNLKTYIYFKTLAPHNNSANKNWMEANPDKETLSLKTLIDLYKI